MPKTSRVRRALPVVLIGACGLATLAVLTGVAASVWASVFRARTGPFIPVQMPPSPFIAGLYKALDPSLPVGVSIPNTRILGAHTLTFRGDDEDEATNVSLCVEKLDGVVVPPDGVFSYNDTVGERTEERGFRPGLMYVGGMTVSAVGGGVCIPSTALYNAALLADMDIVERYNHSGPVHYAVPGLDAAVVFGQKDFQFRNTSDHPVTIHASVLGDELTVTVSGKPVPHRRVVLERVGLGSLPFSEEKEDDPRVPQGQSQVKQEGRAGYVVTVIRTVYRGDKIERRETVSQDTVAPRTRIVLVNPLDDPKSPETLAAKAKEDADKAAAEKATEEQALEQNAEQAGAEVAAEQAKAEAAPMTEKAEKKAAEEPKPAEPPAPHHKTVAPAKAPEPKPAEVKPAEPEPVRPKSVDAKPAHPKPAEDAPAKPAPAPKAEPRAETKLAPAGEESPKPAPAPPAPATPLARKLRPF